MFPSMPGPMTPEMEKMMIAAIQQQIPACRTQAQYNAFMASFDAFRVYLNAIFASQPAEEVEKAKKTMELAFEVAAKVTDISEKLREVPEASVGPEADIFKNAPTKFTEYDVHKRLMVELQKINSLPALNEWYTTNREVLDSVTSPDLRNPLMDQIREKKNSLSTKGA